MYVLLRNEDLKEPSWIYSMSQSVASTRMKTTIASDQSVCIQPRPDRSQVVVCLLAAQKSTQLKLCRKTKRTECNDNWRRKCCLYTATAIGFSPIDRYQWFVMKGLAQRKSSYAIVKQKTVLFGFDEFGNLLISIFASKRIFICDCNCVFDPESRTHNVLAEDGTYS